MIYDRNQLAPGGFRTANPTLFDQLALLNSPEVFYSMRLLPDFSGNTHELYLPKHSPSDWTPTERGWTLYYDGVNNSNSHWLELRDEVPGNDDLSFGDGTTDKAFSIHAAVSPEAWGANKGGIVSKSYSVTSNFIEWLLYINNSGNVGFICYDDSGSVRIMMSTNAVVVADQWLEITATYDGSGSENGLKIYLDGEPQSLFSGSVGSYVAMHQGSSNRFNVGVCFRASASSRRWFQGLIGLVAIWQKELTANEAMILASEQVGAFRKKQSFAGMVGVASSFKPFWANATRVIQ